MNKEGSIIMAGIKDRYKHVLSCIAVVLFMLLHSYARGQKIDSLKNLLDQHPQQDTERVKLMALLANSYRDANLDSMMHIAQRGAQLAESIHFDNGRAACLKELGTSFSASNLYDTTLVCYAGALKIYERTNDLPGQRQTTQSIANIYSRQLKYGKALEYYDKSIALSKKLNDMSNVAHSLINIGINYSELGDYPQSLKYYLDALKLYEREKNNAGIILSLTNIASVYSQLGDAKNALIYVDRSIAMQHGTADRHDMISFYVDIGSVYSTIKDYDNGITFFSKALALADSIGDDYWQNVSLVDIAETYLNKGNLDSAYIKYITCIKNLEKTNDVYISTVAKTGLGKILIKKGQVKEGIEYLLQSYNLAKDNGVKDAVSEDAEGLSNAYEQVKDYNNALAFRKIYEVYKDSLYNEKNNRHVQQIQFDYELEKNKADAQIKSEKQTTAIVSMMAGLALLSVIIILLFRSREREKKNKERSMLQTNEIQLQATKLEELNSFKDKTFSVLSHDLRGPLGAFTNALAMLDKDEISQEEFNDMKPEVNRQLNSLNLLLENLLNWSKSHMQGVGSIVTEPVDVYKIAADNIALFQNTAADKQVVISNNIPQGIASFADAGQVDIVIRNLLNNAIKFTRKGGSVTLSAQKHGQQIAIDVTDTGVGMTQAQLDKLFKVVAKNSTYGTGGEKGIGLGLLLCYEFVKANNGTITATSQQGKGSTFTVMLPKA